MQEGLCWGSIRVTNKFHHGNIPFAALADVVSDLPWRTFESIPSEALNIGTSRFFQDFRHLFVCL